MHDALIYKINWVDIAVAIAFVRIILVGFGRGFTVEIFKLLANVCGIFVAIHFYSRTISDIPPGINIYAKGIGELTVSLALVTPAGNELPLGSEFLNRLPIGIDNIDITQHIYC